MDHFEYFCSKCDQSILNALLFGLISIGMKSFADYELWLVRILNEIKFQSIFIDLLTHQTNKCYEDIPLYWISNEEFEYFSPVSIWDEII